MELAYGKSLPKKKRIEGDIPVYGSGGIGGYHNEALIDGPSIIIGRKGTVGTVCWESGPSFPIDTTFFVRLKVDKCWLPWVYHQLVQLDIHRLGADSAVPGVNRNAILAQKWVIPPDDQVAQFKKTWQPLRDKFEANNEESRTLANLRDTLLPKLISGEVRVPENMQ